MAELTYDPTPADQPEFNEAELEAIAIGEAAAQEEQAQFAGKFKDAQELEKAYIELQKKLGESNGSEETEGMQREEEPATEEVEEEVSPAVSLINEASAQWAETGEVSAEMMEQFAAMSSQDLVSAYIDMQGQLPTATPTADLSEGDVNVIKNSVGGEESYANLMAWAADNLDPADVEAFDALVDQGNARSIRLAAAGLKAEYEAMNGFEGEMVTGRAPTEVADVFRSQQEVVEAMSDPRYDRDPAYRQDVFDKLDRSQLVY